jgi:hypothetical protein
MAGPVYRTWEGRPFDRDGLVADLRRAADEADVMPDAEPSTATAIAAGMARGFRVAAASIEDGDYDADPVTRLLEELRAMVRRCRERRHEEVAT